MAEKPRHEYAYTDSDDWQNVQDRRERKKIQNRLSQRKRRQKVRAENAAANNVANTERTSSTSSQGAGSQQATLDSGFQRDSRSPLATYDQLTYPSASRAMSDAYPPRLSRGTASTGNIEQWPSSSVDPRANLDVPVPSASPPYLTYSHSAPTSLLTENTMMQPPSQFSNPFSSSSVQPQYLSTGYPQDNTYGNEQGLPRYDSLSYRNSVDTSSYIGSAHVSPNIVGGSMSLAPESGSNPLLESINLSRRGSQMSPFDTQTIPMAQEPSYTGSALPSPMPQQGMFMNPVVTDSYPSQQQPLTYNTASPNLGAEYSQGEIMPTPSIGAYIGQSSALQRSPSGGRKPAHNSRVSPY